MIANYTMTFREFLDTYETTAEWQAIKTLFNKFPAFFVAGVPDSTGTTTTIETDSLYDLFIRFYEICEIGAETPDLFVDAVYHKINKLIMENALKIGTLNQIVYSVNAVSGRSEAMMNSFEIKTTDDFTDTGYIYPINATASKMSGKTNNAGTRTQNIPLSQKSFIELVKEILSLPSVYSNMIDSLSDCFMQIL